MHFLFGLSVAFASRSATRLSSRSAVTNRSYLALLVSEGILGVPIGLYLYVFYRDWSFMYLVDGGQVPSAVAVAILAGYPAMATGGYLLGAALLRARRDALLGGVLVAAVVATLGAGVLLRARLVLVGPYSGYHGGYGMRGLTECSLGPVAAVLMATLLAGWAHVLWRAARDARSPVPQ